MKASRILSFAILFGVYTADCQAGVVALPPRALAVINQYVVRANTLGYDLASISQLLRFKTPAQALSTFIVTRGQARVEDGRQLHGPGTILMLAAHPQIFRAVKPTLEECLMPNDIRQLRSTVQTISRDPAATGILAAIRKQLDLQSLRNTKSSLRIGGELYDRMGVIFDGTRR